ncbi:tetratricopeptide repeat protein [Rhodanobacter koreensis]
MTRLFAPPILFAVAAFILPGIGKAQDSTNTSPPAPTSHAAPRYDSDADTGRVQTPSFKTPESDGRPGVYFFYLGAYAVQQKDYAHAIAMYKVAASWAYKPAEYNLAVMYLNGQGTPVDLPRALAWMALAAERNDPQYVKARDLINAHLNDAQFNQANVIMAELLPTYGDKVALARAKTRWHEVLASATGSRVGSSASHLIVGAIADDPNHMGSPYYDVHDGGGVISSGFEINGGHVTDGSIAYQQLRASNNPYDPKFKWLPGATGTVTVEPLTPVKKKDAVSAKKSTDSVTTGSGNPS